MSLPKHFTRRADKAHKTYLSKLKAIESATFEGRSASRLVREYLGTPDIRFSAAVKALGCISEQTLEETTTFACELCPWVKRQHTVAFKLHPKPKGGYRPICELPANLHALHKLIGHVIRAQMRVHPNLYGISPPVLFELRHKMPVNTGREGAVWAIQELMRSGLRHVAEVDIRDCFQSFNPEAFYHLPLPEDVVRNTLDTRFIEFLPRNTSQTSEPENTSGERHKQLLEQQPVQRGNIIGIPGGVTVGNPYGPRGLMQGSPVSSVILAYFLNHVLTELDDVSDAQCIVCFDNIVVAARTEAGLRAMINTLAECLRQCCAGPFELAAPEYRDAEGFRYMGYIFDEDENSIRIDPDRLAKLEARLSKLETKEDHHPNPIRSFKAIRDFCSGFPAISDPKAELGSYIGVTLNGYDERPSLLTELGQSLFAPKPSIERNLVNKILNQCT